MTTLVTPFFLKEVDELAKLADPQFNVKVRMRGELRVGVAGKSHGRHPESALARAFGHQGGKLPSSGHNPDGRLGHVLLVVEVALGGGRGHSALRGIDEIEKIQKFRSVGELGPALVHGLVAGKARTEQELVGLFQGPAGVGGEPLALEADEVGPCNRPRTPVASM